MRYARLTFEKVTEALRVPLLVILNHLKRFIAGIVINNKYLPADRLRNGLGGDTLQCRRQRSCTVMGAQNDRDFRRINHPSPWAPIPENSPSVVHGTATLAVTC